MNRNCILCLSLCFILNNQTIASQVYSSIEKRDLYNHSIPNRLKGLNKTSNYINNSLNVINKVNVNAVHQRIFFLKRLAKNKIWQKIQFDGFLKQGDKHKMLGEIKHRLYLLGYFKPKRIQKNEFSKALASALSLFQKHHGLNPDGIIGPRSLAWLNTSPAQRADLLLRNLHRQQTFFDEVGQDYLLINIPQFQLSLVEQGKGILNSRVIVGKTKRPTPIISSQIKSVVLNPSWNVPRKIVRRDLLPKIRENANYLDEENYEVFDFDDNPVILKEFNWSKLAMGNFPYKLRQKPGPSNALGYVKFHFNNKHSVYIHDTPDKTLFDKHRRDFSSGCIRVEKADELAQWFKEQRLVNQTSWHQVIEHNEENIWFKVKEPLPIYLVYWTAWVDSNNHVQYRNDIYDKENVILKNKKPQLDLRRNQTIAIYKHWK
ncbi:L,D-transpeptidase family protein [Pseudoalteromonas denitrificans]|uniref:Putative peptidoglycan binding domain-containing protein n=1 Tax=Pseudoalteromonas denitrificans DSM 6059 TaxID=1123010 RepID=A0A1I1S759_9GAMM|nr:L,D-transpeptidase family protein [Pseudoalteromonas denitrificans]SFD38800.1 Putative peptidoglycan binding domain-containing protein [Pseudoalteromonas denitrificans DSM 6059]